MTSGKIKISFRSAAVLLAALALAPLLPRPAGAVINPTINYQGFLLSKVTSLPVETPQDLNFIIYDAPVGGNALFTEGRCNVNVAKGRYDVAIGSLTAGGVPGAIFLSNTSLWLEIQIDADGSCSGSYEPMTPRVRLQASPYSFNSLYASTASAATSVFSADVIAALPNTTYGAITISTNLFVQGGISVGSISPGQKLSVNGVVESTGSWPNCATPGNYTCGFKFPDGSVQVKAAALTMWDVNGVSLYTINEGNTNIGGGITDPQARLHISSATGDAGSLLLVSTGTGAAQSQLFLVNGNGQVYANAYYGDGSTLSHIVRQGGDTMTGQLTLAASSFTATSPLGAAIPKLRLAPGVEISSAALPAAARGGILLSSHVYLTPGATYYGDGSGLYNLVSLDATKVAKTGDAMTGQLMILNSTLTVTGDAFSVGGSTSFAVLGGNAAVGSASFLAKLTVGGGIIATSSITSQGSIYAQGAVSAQGAISAQGALTAPSLGVTGLGTFYNVTAATGTFWSWDPGTGYSLDTAATINVRTGSVRAPSFIGDGSLLTSVSGTDATRVLKAGDTMTGNLHISGSSVTVAARGTHQYALTVGSAAVVNDYTLAVTTAGYVGVQVSNPTAPLEVNTKVLISNAGGSAHLDLNSNVGYNYIHWSDSSLATNGPAQGALGYLIEPNGRDLVYRSMGITPASGGQEVFRIKSDDFAYWQFGIGTSNPTERFHVATGALFSGPTVNPILYISTATGLVSIRTAAQTHALTVNGGLVASSSITALGDIHGNNLTISSITAPAGNTYDGVVFSTTIYATSRLAVGVDSMNLPFSPLAALHARGDLILDHKNDEKIMIMFYPNPEGGVGADSYMRWEGPEASLQNKGVLGIKANSRDLVYRGGATDLDSGVETFRAKPDGTFIVGSGGTSFAPFVRFHVITDMSVSREGAAPALFVSTASSYVGISTGAPAEGLHVASSLLAGANRASAALYVSTRTGYVGIATGYPAEGLHSAASLLVGAARGSARLYVSTSTGYVGISTGNPQARLDVAGYANFSSSLTLAGTGLAGTQTVLDVKSGALLVRNDGRVGVGTASPATALDVNGSAQFGSGVNKSTFTADGFWLPRSMDTAALQAASPPAVGAVVFNSSINDLCVSTGTAVGQWALTGSKGLANCFN
ncbi:MAG TPA: hypothetical protein DEQ38_11230 [Elusimicrobia bacterium]|nr:MAG: hypothetical protein A2089_01765 [Elusimicrobia bacterium GWD2_63_28]HCC48669.1 hypothetical protein [Elusimicrobiota bacterium]